MRAVDNNTSYFIKNKSYKHLFTKSKTCFLVCCFLHRSSIKRPTTFYNRDIKCCLEREQLLILSQSVFFFLCIFCKRNAWFQ
jgi:hypothetical protein